MNIQAMMKQAQKLQKDMVSEKNKIDNEICNRIKKKEKK